MPEILEKLSSRSIQSNGGKGSGKREFFAQGYASPAEVFATIGTTVGSVAVPDKGDPYPGLPGLIAKDFAIAPVPGQNDLYSMTWNYEMMSISFLSAPEVTPSDSLPNELGYVELSSEIRTEFQLAWRSEPTKPGDNGVPDPDKDIGGQPIDADGNPTSIMRRKQELVLTETVNEVNFGLISKIAFRRNNKPFLGAAPGRVLYRGASVRRTGVQLFTIAHSFVDDQYFHCEQQPDIDQNGKSIDSNSDAHADHVVYIQPFPLFADFNALSNQFSTL